MIGKKQRSTHEEFVELVRISESIVTKAQTDRLFEQAVEEVVETCRGRRSAFCWSGGKDSLVLELICREAGIDRCVLVVCDLEYPAFMRWVEARKTQGLRIVNTGQDIDWLIANPGMLFPTRAATSSRWFSIVQHAGQDRYASEEKLGVLLFGRRRQDGNWIGTESGGSHVKRGIRRQCPIRDWKHEEVFAFLQRRGVALPPFYEWPRGYRVGTGPWAKRRGSGPEQCWREIHQIDPSIVLDAAKRGFEPASRFLDGLK